MSRRDPSGDIQLLIMLSFIHVACLIRLDIQIETIKGNMKAVFLHVM